MKSAPKQRFKITKFFNPSGQLAWRVTGYKSTGERVRVNYPTAEQAEAERQRLCIEDDNAIVSVRLTQSRLTQSETAMAERAFAELRRSPNLHGMTLVEVVRYAAKRYTPPTTTKLLPELVSEFLADKEAKGKRDRTVSTLKSKLSVLAAEFGERHAADVTSADLLALLTARQLHGNTLRNIRRGWSSFFSWCVHKNYTPENPVKKIQPKYDLPEVDDADPEVLPVAAVRKLFNVAHGYKDGALIPYLTLATFCAIRPAELQRLTWDDINIEGRTVTISSRIAKKRKRRTVAISDNAVDWLASHALRRTPIVAPNWRKDFDAVKLLAGYGSKSTEKKINSDKPEGERVKLLPWPQNVLRHVGVTMHVMMHQSESGTALWAGNSPDMVQSAYKGLATLEEAKKFWEIRPTGKRGGVVKLPKTA